MTILNRYPEFFESCKKAYPSGGIDFADMSNSDIDGFVISYMTDLGGDSARAAYHLMMSHDEDELNDAYSACQLELNRLVQHYNDYCDVYRNRPASQSLCTGMEDAGHDRSDF